MAEWVNNQQGDQLIYYSNHLMYIAVSGAKVKRIFSAILKQPMETSSNQEVSMEASTRRWTWRLMNHMTTSKDQLKYEFHIRQPLYSRVCHAIGG